MNEYAVIIVHPVDAHKPIVVEWHETSGAAVSRASWLNQNDRGEVYRAVETTWDGKFRSLTGESLYA